MSTLQKSDVINIGLTVFFGVLSIIFFFSSSIFKEKNPQIFVYGTSPLVSKKNSANIEVLISGKSYTNLESFSFAIRNISEKTIRKADIDTPIRVRFSNSCPKVLSSSSSTGAWPNIQRDINHQILINNEENYVDLKFDFLNPNEFIDLELIRQSTNIKDDCKYEFSYRIAGISTIDIIQRNRYSPVPFVQIVDMIIILLFSFLSISFLERFVLSTNSNNNFVKIMRSLFPIEGLRGMDTFVYATFLTVILLRVAFMQKDSRAAFFEMSIFQRYSNL